MFPDVKTFIEVGDRIFQLFHGTTTRMFAVETLTVMKIAYYSFNQLVM